MNAAKSLLPLSLLATLTATAIAQDAQPRLGAPVPELDASQQTRFVAGQLIFNKLFGPADGRGPIFNDGACQGCHLFPASGGGSAKFVTRFGIAATDSTPFDPLAGLGGSLQQAEANDPINCAETVPAEADVVIHRITPPCWGFGYVEAIPDADIKFNADNPPKPYISGKVHMVQPLEDPFGPQRVGRFGWKAQDATVLTFSGGASGNELGLTNRLLPTEQAPNGDLVKLAACDTVADPEDGPDAQGFDQIDRMTDFQRFLAVPPQTPKSGMTGEAIFNAIGCADCHMPSFTTGVTAEPALSGKTIRPYTDFLLHDAGTGDGIVQGSATELEFRTTPLWGLLPRAQTGLLHDGVATGGSMEQVVEMAILAHGNEAATAQDAYSNPTNGLNPTQKAQLIAFLLSLGQLEFDVERDNDIDGFDWFFIFPLFNGPTPAYTPDDFAAINDVDQDGDFDMRDVGAFQRAFTGQ